MDSETRKTLLDGAECLRAAIEKKERELEDLRKRLYLVEKALSDGPSTDEYLGNVFKR